MTSTLGSALERNTQLYPNKPAIVVEEEVLTYNELNTEVNRFSSALMKNKLGRELELLYVHQIR